ncbi:MAG: phosphonate C-P lyase system protein PhnG [Neomegalonema sp.]|nr:phosphonate C-P lyase system protein PhnG [Neomegalonema sp.]
MTATQQPDATATASDSPLWRERAVWFSELAKADGAALNQLWADFGINPEHELLRAPEIGLVMARGRVGGEGEAFNLGEVSATRCSVRLLGKYAGVEGHAYALGRDRRKAKIAALCDALMQTPLSERVAAQILTPLYVKRQAADRSAAEKAAATRVEFFTMTRGED